MSQLRFEIFRGREINGNLTNLRLCGFAFQNEGDSYYKVKLLFLPETVYYMSKNHGDGYTLFSKMVLNEEGKVIFQNPVGFAKIIENNKTHLYLKFPDLASHMFMSLFPSGKDLVA